MKFHIANKLCALAVMLIIALTHTMSLSAQVPDAPNPPRLVNDFAGLFSAQQVKELEDSLDFFARKTSNQIAIVTMSDLGDMEPAQMAYEIGEKWGVGGKEDRNGVVILIKPKNETNGQAFIATGYGLEGALPDAICKRIVDSKMIPSFRENDYFSGVVHALEVIKPIVAGEYSKEQFEEDEDEEFIWALIIFFGIIAIVYIWANYIDKDKGNDKNSGTMGHGGFFGGPVIFGGGSRSSGDDSFGGFGGGSFGGGGAGGSW